MKNLIILVAPSRVRGLKQNKTFDRIIVHGRTLTGAWIETCSRYKANFQNRVAPSRVRGLKLSIADRCIAGGSRRTLTGAWIETPRLKVKVKVKTCRTLTGAWIETTCCVEIDKNANVAPSRVRGLKHHCAMT